MKFGRVQAEQMLKIGGIKPEDEHYHFLLKLLADIMKRETRRAEAIAHIGAKIQKLATDREIRRLAGMLAEQEPSGGMVLQISRAFGALAKLAVREGERQSGNRERTQTERNGRIAERFAELTATMSERAAAGKIRREMNLQISNDRIRKIGRTKK